MLHGTSRDKLVWGYISLVSIEKVYRLQRTSDKLVWCVKRRFIGYTGLVVIY